MTRFRLNLRFEMPNFPSIALRILSSSKACFFFSGLTKACGLPKGGPLILICCQFSVFYCHTSIVADGKFRQPPVSSYIACCSQPQEKHLPGLAALRSTNFFLYIAVAFLLLFFFLFFWVSVSSLLLSNLFEPAFYRFSAFSLLFPSPLHRGGLLFLRWRLGLDLIALNH